MKKLKELRDVAYLAFVVWCAVSMFIARFAWEMVRPERRRPRASNVTRVPILP